jgi:cytidine deaminase
MKKEFLKLDYTIYEKLDELKAIDQKLIHAAEHFLQLSYAPYSNFHVSAAILLENGEIISGANQENASYPLCLCAERVALHHAAMRFPKMRIETMAIMAKNEYRNDLGPTPPCGACRQVISEYEHILKNPIRLLLKGDQDEIWEFSSVTQVLPLGFDPHYLDNPSA